MDKSSSIAELAKALHEAQAEMPKVKFNAINPFLKNKYADLGAVIEASKPVLKKHGLSVSQFPTSQEDKVGVNTILMHTSGEFISETCLIPVGDEKGKSLAQVAGSVISYLRRYSLASVLGIYADEDGDGNQPKSLVEEAKTMGGSEMTLEYAKTFTDSTGKFYNDYNLADLSTKKSDLQMMLDTGKKGDKTLSQRQLEEAHLRWEVVNLLIESKTK